MAPLIAGTVLFVFVFIFSENFSEGLAAGISNCANIVVPSLFPFLVASSLAGSGELPTAAKKVLEPITQFLFKLPAESIPAVILGQYGGYLSGAKAAESLHSCGTLSNSQAEKLLFFCINSGIGFSVNAVGNGMLCSRQAGKVLFASVCISSILLGIISRFVPDNSSFEKKSIKSKLPFSSAVVNSVTSGTSSILNACAFVAIFSGLAAVTEAEISNKAVKLSFFCLSEVTNGCIYAANKVSLPLLAAVCAFGGICVHLQIFSITKSIKIKIPRFYLFRFLHSLFSYLCCSAILHFYPIEEEVFLSFSKNAAVFSFSAPAAISLLFLCALLILDLDNGREIC